MLLLPCRRSRLPREFLSCYFQHVQRRLQLLLRVGVTLLPVTSMPFAKGLLCLLAASLFKEEHTCLVVRGGVVRMMGEQVLEVLRGFFFCPLFAKSTAKAYR